VVFCGSKSANISANQLLERMFEKYQNLFRSPQPPLKKGAKFLKVPLVKGDLGGSTGVIYHTKKFSNTL
jgi:hypothetical protein